MKHNYLAALLIPMILGTAACSRNDSSTSSAAAAKTPPAAPDTTVFTGGETSLVLRKDSPAAQLKDALAEKIPELKRAPDTVLLETSVCTITIAELLNNLSTNLGTRASRLTEANPGIIKNNLQRHTARIAVQKILLNRALQAGYSATTLQVDSALAGTSQQYGGLDAFKSLLAEYNVPFDFVRRDTKKTVIINRYLQKELGPNFISASNQSDLIASYVANLKKETNFTFVGW